MANIGRRKKVTDPLDDKVKARIFGSDRFYNPVCSSGDVEAPCLSNLLCGFLDEHDVEEDENESDDVFEILTRVILNEGTYEYRNVLLGQVLKAVQIFWFVKSDASLLRRNVMAFLRGSGGYNAGICKTKWESCGGLTAGTYDFIDVVGPKSCRYFEIARRTGQYERLLRALPSVFVGKSDTSKRMVRIMSDGARRSLKTQGLHLPPWRKTRFMHCKWFGKYNRTSNLVPANTYSPVR